MKTKTYQQQLYDACKEHIFLAQQALDRYDAAKTDCERECAKIDNLQHLASYYALQWALDKTIDIKQEIKQAQIDVLNELKKKTHNYYPSIDSYCISQHIVLVRDIDELIKEVQND